jgi:5-methylcytosine-specific restriction protein A
MNQTRKQERTRGRAWMEIRKRVLDDEPLCRECDRPATVIDHIKALTNGGTDDRENLQPLCDECHEIKTRRDLNQKEKKAVSVDGIPEGW